MLIMLLVLLASLVMFGVSLYFTFKEVQKEESGLKVLEVKTVGLLVSITLCYAVIAYGVWSAVGYENISAAIKGML